MKPLRCCAGMALLTVGAAAGVTGTLYAPQVPAEASRLLPAVESHLPAVHLPWNDAVGSPMAGRPTPSPVVLEPVKTTAAKWTASDCSWVISTLTDDYGLDVQAESATPAPGPTPYPSQAQYYADAAQQWQTALYEANGVCANGLTMAPLNGATCTQAEGWFTTAEAIHQADIVSHPQNTQWDDTWSANYQRLDDLWQEACGS
jgi:hypothetical protein